MIYHSLKKHLPSITIAIPAYNEEECIEKVLSDTFKKLPKYFDNYEVLVINDGSTDRTKEILKKILKKEKKLRVINQKNKGFSMALLKAIKNANKDFIAYMPADGQFLVDDMRHCFVEMGNADLILGYRGGRSDYSNKRIFYSYGYLLLLLLLFDIKYMDVGWVHIWRTKHAKKIKFSSPGGIFLLTEIVVKFKQSGLRLIEAPSYYHPRIGGEVKNAKPSVVFDTFKSAVKLWFEFHFKK